MGTYSDPHFRESMNMGVGPMPERPERTIRAVDIEGHPAEETIDTFRGWTLVRTWQGRWYACHPVHGHFFMERHGSVAGQRRAFRAFVRNGGALPALR